MNANETSFQWSRLGLVIPFLDLLVGSVGFMYIWGRKLILPPCVHANVGLQLTIIFIVD